MVLLNQYKNWLCGSLVFFTVVDTITSHIFVCIGFRSRDEIYILWRFIFIYLKSELIYSKHKFAGLHSVFRVMYGSYPWCLILHYITSFISGIFTLPCNVCFDRYDCWFASLHDRYIAFGYALPHLYSIFVWWCPVQEVFYF